MPTVKNGDAEIHFDVSGPDDAPAIVFAHGRGGNAASWWQQVPAFADRYRCLVFDHRGFGRSTCAPDAVLVRHYVEDLGLILDAAGIERFSMVCQSMGGWTGLRFAIANPDRMRCIVLANTPGGLMTEALYEHAKARPSTVENAAFNNYALAPDYHEREPVMGYLFNRIGAFNSGPGPSSWAVMPRAERDLDPAALAGYATPTMMITGESDRVFPRDLLHEVAPNIPGCQVVDLPGVGHSAYFEDARAFNEVVGGFLQRHGG